MEILDTLIGPTTGPCPYGINISILEGDIVASTRSKSTSEISTRGSSLCAVWRICAIAARDDDIPEGCHRASRAASHRAQSPRRLDDCGAARNGRRNLRHGLALYYGCVLGRGMGRKTARGLDRPSDRSRGAPRRWRCLHLDP